MRIMKKEDKIIKGMASYIDSLDIDEFICKKIKCLEYCNGATEVDEYECIDCIINFFSKDCKYLEDNEVCVNSDSVYCADFVGPEQCGKCYFKEFD